MIKVLKKYLNTLYSSASKTNESNIRELLEKYGPFETLLDVGCWDGKETVKWAKYSKASQIIGIEIVDKVLLEAENRGIKTHILNVDRDKWPIENESIDCIVTNQVVEHLSNLDLFFSESYRVLKSGGVIITSTNNLSSFHNILSLILGWTPFDLTNCSINKKGIGNPISLHRGEDTHEQSWTHKCIYTSKWLKEWQESYKFKYLETRGAGLYPFPSSFGKYLKLYSAFVTLACKK